MTLKELVSKEIEDIKGKMPEGDYVFKYTYVPISISNGNVTECENNPDFIYQGFSQLIFICDYWQESGVPSSGGRFLPNFDCETRYFQMNSEGDCEITDAIHLNNDWELYYKSSPQFSNDSLIISHKIGGFSKHYDIGWTLYSRYTSHLTDGINFALKFSQETLGSYCQKLERQNQDYERDKERLAELEEENAQFKQRIEDLENKLKAFEGDEYKKSLESIKKIIDDVHFD